MSISSGPHPSRLCVRVCPPPFLSSVTLPLHRLPRLQQLLLLVTTNALIPPLMDAEINFLGSRSLAERTAGEGGAELQEGRRCGHLCLVGGIDLQWLPDWKSASKRAAEQGDQLFSKPSILQAAIERLAISFP
jgi:hypothetical protein